MLPDFELCLEAALGDVIPPDCYAAVHALSPEACQQVPAPPTRCVPYKANSLGGAWSAGAGPFVVDIFQKVGSITVSVVDPGSLTEGVVEWPGLGQLHLRIFAAEHVAASPAGTLGPVEGSPAQVSLGVPPPLPGTPTIIVKAADDRDLPEALKPFSAFTPPDRGSEAEQPFSEKLTQSPGPRTPPPCSPAIAPREPDLEHDTQADEDKALEEKAAKMYKPVSLNNCDQIIPNLYLGGVTAAEDTKALVEQGIRAVCCCCRELEFPTEDFSSQLDYYRVDVEDMSREPISLFFPEATEFIHSWISHERTVLVHCRAGTSRSPSVVIAYLMTYQGYSLHDALFLVRSHRSCVCPNVGFIEQLGEYEEEQRNTEPTIDVNKYISWYENPNRAAVPDLKPD